MVTVNQIIYWDRIKCSKDLVDILTSNNQEEEVKEEVKEDVKKDPYKAHKECIDKLRDGKYKQINLEKLSGYDNLYSIRVNKADRVLFHCAQGSRDAVVLAAVDNHQYDKTLRSLETVLKEGVDPDSLVDITRADLREGEPVLMDHPPEVDEVIYYDRNIFPLSIPQLDVLNNTRFPLIINGTAGSGKTVVAEQLLLLSKDLGYEKAYYFAPTDNLVDFMRDQISQSEKGEELIKSSKVVVSTYRDYVKNSLEPLNVKLCDFDENAIVKMEFQLREIELEIKQLKEGGKQSQEAQEKADELIEDLDRTNKFKTWYDSSKFSSNSPKEKSSTKSISDASSVYLELRVAASYKRDEYMKLGHKQSSLSSR